MLSEREKARVAYHLGYPNAQTGSGMSLGYPMTVELLFPVYATLAKTDEATAEIIRRCLAVLDNIEEKQAETVEAVVAEKIGDVTIAKNFEERLARVYEIWVNKLSNASGVLPYPYRAGNSFNGRRVS